MKTRTLVLALTAVGLITGTGSLSAQVDEPWHLSAQFGGMNLDSDRNTRNDDIWWQVGFGRFFGNHFSLDLEYDEFSGTFSDYDSIVPGATFDQWKLGTWGLTGRYHFGKSKVRPYIAFGAGRTKHSNISHSGDAFMRQIGLGLQGQISRHWSTRAQIMYRYDGDGDSTDRSKYYDLIYSIGLNFDFGGRPAPPPPPPPEPAPAPPPPPPNPDLDGDGVLNERDKCPNTRPGAVVDLDGCEVEAVIELEGVNFDFDKATLRPEAKVILNEAAALLQKHEKVIVEIAGHTDSVGSEEYNQGLSERRADAVEAYLTSKGVKATRLSSKGYGELRPIASNDTEEGRAENRRVEMIVLDR